MAKLHIKEVTAASVLGNTYVPGNLIDSNLQTMYHSDHPQMPRKLIWVQLELTNVKVVSKIQVTNRGSYGDRFKLVNFRVGLQKVKTASSKEEQENSISKNELCSTYEGPGKNGEVITIKCEKPVAGRFITMQMIDNCGSCYMNIMEVEVYRNIADLGKYVKTFKNVCMYVCIMFIFIL